MMSNGKNAKVTPFAARVYAMIEQIPPGRVATYGEVAQALGCGSARAVGQALRRNPFAPQVPCHRVVSGDGCLGGYHGAVAGEPIEEKQKRLRDEGVVWCSAERVDLRRSGHVFSGSTDGNEVNAIDLGTKQCP